MSLGLHLCARLAKPARSPKQFLTRIETWLRTTYPEMRPQISRNPSTLLCQIHPAAEEFELSLIDPAHLLASASTGGVGPGYHIFLTNLLKALAHHIKASWLHPAADDEDFADDTGYFFTGDEDHLRHEMTRWLSAIAGLFFDGSLDPDTQGTALCIPLNPRFETAQPALTPLGPRSRAWLAQTAKDGAAGSDFFPWWTPGCNAEFYLRRALTQMWLDIRWRPPINDSETAALESVAADLDQAFHLDPHLDYPWAEWKQVLQCLAREAGPQEQLVDSRAHTDPTIGYRRANVFINLGDWTLKIPGSFSDFDTDQYNRVFSGDPPREIWFAVYPLIGSLEWHKKDRQERVHIDYLIERDGYFAHANLSTHQTETGEPFFVLNSTNLTDAGQKAVFTVIFFNPDHKDWALQTWQSLQPPVSG